jgi:hypothetical protein
MFGDPLSRLFFGGETLDHFRLAIRPKNIDHPAKSGIFSRHENGPEFGHPANMRLRRAGSSQYRCLIRRGGAAGGIPWSDYKRRPKGAWARRTADTTIVKKLRPLFRRKNRHGPGRIAAPGSFRRFGAIPAERCSLSLAVR